MFKTTTKKFSRQYIHLEAGKGIDTGELAYMYSLNCNIARFCWENRYPTASRPPPLPTLSKGVCHPCCCRCFGRHQFAKQIHPTHELRHICPPVEDRGLGQGGSAPVTVASCCVCDCRALQKPEAEELYYRARPPPTSFRLPTFGAPQTTLMCRTPPPPGGKHASLPPLSHRPTPGSTRAPCSYGPAPLGSARQPHSCRLLLPSSRSTCRS